MNKMCILYLIILCYYQNNYEINNYYVLDRVEVAHIPAGSKQEGLLAGGVMAVYELNEQLVTS